jgi:hypothetical protein
MPWFKTNRTLATVDLAAFLEEEDEDDARDEYFRKTTNLRADIRQIGQYQRYRNKYGLTEKQAELAANIKMPATKRKAPSSSSSSKKPRTTKKYSGTGKKNSDKYGAKSVDWETVKKLADAAAKKEIGKNIETQYSQMMVTMTHKPDIRTTVGYNLAGLNFDTVNNGFKPHQAMIFNLCYLSQPGGALAPGYRVGQRINAKYFKLTLTANLPQVTADCTYHMRILKRKNDQSGQTAYAQPALTGLDQLQLFKPNTDGPLAAVSSYGELASAQMPFPYFASAMRPNTEAWTFVHDGYKDKFVKAQPTDTDVGDQKHVASFCQSLYYKLDEEWEFVTRTGSDIKGGNYFVVVWREGGPDFVQYTTPEHVTDNLGLIQLKLSCELAFKDG